MLFKAGVNVTTGGNSTGVTGIMEGSSVYVYTTNFYNTIYIGQPISSSITLYRTGLEAYNDHSNDIPAYFKHKLVDPTMETQWCVIGSDGFNSCNANNYYFTTSSSCQNELFDFESEGVTYSCQSQERVVPGTGTVSESYLEFVITPETAASYSGLTAGTYTLRGGDGGVSYNSNVATLISAFGINNCIHDEDTTGDNYHCYYGDYSGYRSLSVTVYNDGWVTSNNGLFCHIYHNAADCGIT